MYRKIHIYYSFVFFILGLLIIKVNILYGSSLTFDGEIRERFETMDGVNKKTYGDSSIDAKGIKRGDSDDTLLLQRIFAGFTYSLNSRIKLALHLYDSRAWGWSLNQNDFIKNKGTSDEFVMDPYEEYLELLNAYFYVKDLFIKGFSMKLGRQRIWYGDRRVFGPGCWGNAIGWLWDAIRFSYRKNRWFVDFWYGQTKTKDPESFSLIHKHVFQGVGMYSHFQLQDYGAIEPFFAWKNNLFHHVVPEEDTYYIGARFYNKNFHNINWDFTYVSKLGKIGDKTVRAYAYVAKIGYTFNKFPWRPNLVIGRVFASGDSNPSDGVIKTFTKPFGSTCGIHYGRMDIMSWSNLVDNQISLYLSPYQYINIKFAFHDFNLDKPEDKWMYFGYKNKQGNSYKHLGNEFDFQLCWNLHKNIKLAIIYAYFEAGDFVIHNVENNNAQHFFLQFQYKFSVKIK